MQIIRFLLLFALTARQSRVLSQPNPDVCIPGPPPGGQPPLPKLPTQFTTTVEAKFTGVNSRSMERMEFYDSVHNTGASQTISDGMVKHTTYDYDLDQQITINVEEGTCDVTTLTNTSIAVFGFHIENGRGHINSISDVLHFGGEFNEVYGGTDTVRGIQVDHWVGCVYSEVANITYRTDYYFTLDGYKTAGGGNQIPVRVVVNGTAQNSTLDPNTHEIIPIPNAYHSFYHVYDFFSFRDEFDEAEFIAHKAPMGYVCPGRKSDVEIPEFPPQFAVHIETAKKQLKKTHYSWEYYDQPGKMVQMRALPNDDMQVGNYIWNPYNWDPVDLLHDYNTGIEYTIDTVNGNCTIKPIWKYSDDARLDDPGNPDSNITMRDVTNFVYANDVNWTYEGKTVIRDIDTHAWIATRNDWPNYAVHVGYEVNSTWEYFFADTNWTMDGSKAGTERESPIRLRVQATWKINDTIKETDWVYNFFNFQKVTKPLLNTFDVRGCYKPKEKKTLAFLFDGQDLYNLYVINNTNQFYADLRNGIAHMAGISPLRVVDVFVDTVEDQLKAWFTLLDYPNIVGDVTHVKPQLNLTTAYTKLKSAIDNGQMIITIHCKNDKAFLQVKTETLVEDANNPRPPEPTPSESKSGYSGGAMAAIAIVMLLIGGGVGLGVGFYFWKHNRGFVYSVQE